MKNSHNILRTSIVLYILLNLQSIHGQQQQIPQQVCDAPVYLNTTATTAIVGNGTAVSCTAAELAAKISNGGIVQFSCGSLPITIPITTPLILSNQADTLIDGGDKVTLVGVASSIFTLAGNPQSVSSLI